ncbi:unnamed protein product [Calypogeia fissa]
MHLYSLKLIEGLILNSQTKLNYRGQAAWNGGSTESLPIAYQTEKEREGDYWKDGELAYRLLSQRDREKQIEGA